MESTYCRWWCQSNGTGQNCHSSHLGSNSRIISRYEGIMMMSNKITFMIGFICKKRKKKKRCVFMINFCCMHENFRFTRLCKKIQKNVVIIYILVPVHSFFVLILTYISFYIIFFVTSSSFILLSCKRAGSKRVDTYI